MLRINLATRPFYNERVVHCAIALLALTLIAGSVFNVRSIIELSRRNSALGTEMTRDESVAADAGSRAGAIRQQINRDELQQLADVAREANALIDRRTFSWTELFNRIEMTLPPDVRMTSVQPQIEEGEVSISMVVIGRRVEDIDRFIENLEETGAFQDVLARQEEATEDRMYRATLFGRYVTIAPPPEAPAGGGQSAARP